MVRPQSLKICQFQINTGFIPEQETLITFSSNDLDDLPDADQVPHDFSVSLSLSFMDNEFPPSRNPPWLPAKPIRNAQHIFSSQSEFEEMVDNFVTKPSSINKPTPVRSAASVDNAYFTRCYRNKARGCTSNPTSTITTNRHAQFKPAPTPAAGARSTSHCYANE
ncbi:PREDICTED: uncharacterized protein LOC108370004 [Rhagoletis zephyria]|uniref:uncharacterized protein LOC108370004 n=1 Tax=Rhagoletis zephyria TaxID=28612 RepID=UPI0008113AB6|nr:PREDICTED: uncharacterized protein LOC108370004 [Rhagoletis zephyria]